jgi:hypothetical protein
MLAHGVQGELSVAFERGTGGACCDDNNNNNNNNEDDDVGRSDDRVTESSRQEGTYLREGAL